MVKNKYTGHGFWFKPKPSHNISKKKKKPLFKESCNIKNMQLYHNLVKKNWGVPLGASATITLILYGPQKRSPFFYTTKKNNTFNTIFNMTTHYCQLCGKPYKKKYKNQRYCSPDCSQEARRLKSRIYFSKWYTKNKTYCWARKKGTGTLGPHRHTTDKEEYEAIQTELRRLQLRK